MNTKRLSLLLFLVSGASGLMYEVVWSRMFVLVLGTTVYSVSTVLGVFMGGLALGSYLFGRVVDRPGANGLRLYACLEFIIGVYAFLLPVLMDLSNDIYRGLWASVGDSFTGLMAVRLLLAVLILIVPATLMGGTLPALSKYLVRETWHSGREIGLLYAINTLGAVAGCFVTGFFLLELLGMQGTLWLAAGGNFLVAIVAIFWARRSGAEPVVETERTPKKKREDRISPAVLEPGRVRVALGLYAACGFAALALEVLWTRALMYFVSVDTWSFTAMLSAFLMGLGLGSLVMARFAARFRNPLFVLGILQVLVGASAALGIPLMENLYAASTSFAEGVAANDTLFEKALYRLYSPFLLMLVPTLIMGASFPLISNLYVAARGEVGRGVGTLYALNTLGAIAGSLVAGFVLIPLVGLQQGILIIASVYILIGVCMGASGLTPGKLRRAYTMVGVALVLVMGGLSLGVERRPIILRSKFFKDPAAKNTLLYHREGTAASLAVVETSSGRRLLNINGITTAINNYLDMQVHRMLSHLPILLHPSPRKILVVGFGMGSTVWGCCQHDVERVDVVELLRDEKESARFFEDINHGVLNHPKLRFVEGDGRNFLLATSETYDVISFNAIHPRYSANLYTRDFYSLCQERLSEKGVICAWMTQNAMADKDWRMLCRSFTAVFPHSSMWYCNPEHFCLIGTQTPLEIDIADWARRMGQPGVAEDLADSNFGDPPVLATRFMFGGEVLRRYLAGDRFNTDDKPLIEFSRETKVDERKIIEGMLGLKQGVLSVTRDAGGSGKWRQNLDIHDRSATWMMKGQIEHWYPLKENSGLSEIYHRKALILTPRNEDVRENLTFSRRYVRKLQDTLKKAPNNPRLLFSMALIAIEEGQLGNAQGLLERVLRRRSPPLQAMEKLGLVLCLREDWKKGVQALEILARNNTLGPREAYLFSLALEQVGRATDARAFRAAALSADERIPEWYRLVKECTRRTGGG